jgi:Peptidase M50B-like
MTLANPQRERKCEARQPMANASRQIHLEEATAVTRSHTTMASYEWKLNGCCGAEERIFLCFYAAYVVLFVFVSKTLVMKPMRLLAVFLHEFSHAAMAWLTGGKVKAIEVNENEGTVTICCGERRNYKATVPANMPVTSVCHS